MISAVRGSRRAPALSPEMTGMTGMIGSISRIFKGKTWWRRLWSDRALSCFSEVVLKVQSTTPCKTQDFVHEPCSVDVKKWFKNIGGAPQNELRVVFAVAKTRFLEKNNFENICPTHIRSFFTSAVCSLPVSDLFVDRFHEFPKSIQ